MARTPIPLATVPNSRWSVDFVHDQLANGRRFRVLNVIDDVTKECLAAIPDTSISGKRVVREITKVETAIEPKFQEHFVAANAIPHKTDPFPELAKIVPLPHPHFNTGGDGGADGGRRRRKRA